MVDQHISRIEFWSALFHSCEDFTMNNMSTGIKWFFIADQAFLYSTGYLSPVAGFRFVLPARNFRPLHLINGLTLCLILLFLLTG